MSRTWTLAVIATYSSIVQEEGNLLNDQKSGPSFLESWNIVEKTSEWWRQARKRKRGGNNTNDDDDGGSPHDCKDDEANNDGTGKSGKHSKLDKTKVRERLLGIHPDAHGCAA